MKKDINMKNRKLKFYGAIILSGLVVGGASSYALLNKYDASNDYVGTEANADVVYQETSLKKLEERRKNQEEFDDRMAFYFQQSKIKMDGSIRNPQFFGKLSYETALYVIQVKDGDKELLAKYLKRKVSPENVAKFKAELDATIAIQKQQNER